MQFFVMFKTTAAAASMFLRSWQLLLDLPSHSDELGLTPLIRAASGGDVAMVRMLLHDGADAGKRCKLGDDHVSAKDVAQSNTEIVKLLDDAIASKAAR